MTNRYLPASGLLAVILLAIALLYAPVSAFADCDEVGSPEWDELNSDMVRAYNSGDFQSALNYSLKLESKCADSPLLMFTISDIYRRLDNEPESLRYIQFASQKSINYDLPPQIMERIWYRRAELESPEMRKAKQTIEELRARHEAADFTQVDYERLQWSGTGVAAAGGAIAIAGAIVMGVYFDKASGKLNCVGDDLACTIQTSDFDGFNEDIRHEKVGIGLFSAGLGLGVAGAALAVFSHIELNNFTFVKSSDESTVSMSFGFSPACADFRLAF